MYHRRRETAGETSEKATRSNIEETMLYYAWQVVELVGAVDLNSEWEEEPARAILQRQPDLLESFNTAEKAAIFETTSGVDLLESVTRHKALSRVLDAPPTL